MNLWDRLANAFRAEDKKYKNIFFNKSQVVNVDYDDAPILDGTSYCRIWLEEMRLARGVDWFRTRYPMAYAAIRYDYGGKLVTVPYVGGLDYFKELTQANLDKVIQINRPLTPLFPFNRGIVDLQAALFSIKASDPVAKFLSAMGRLSKLIPVPELSSVITLVEPLYNGIDELISAGESDFQLGYQKAFVGAGAVGSNLLRQGYFAAIMAEHDDFNDDDLRIVNDSLQVLTGGGNMAPLAGYNYMLFRIELRNQQDWESLSSIKELVERAENAIELDQIDIARDLLTSIKIAVVRSPDVAKKDREGMFSRIREHLYSLGLEGAQGSATKRSLFEIMQQPFTSLDKETISELDQLERLFSS
jgi:hypothetical protein